LANGECQKQCIENNAYAQDWEVYMNTSEKILRLKQEKDVVILAHYYVDGDVQDIADFVGDSYALAKKAAEVEQKNILFAGVAFMGESAKLLNPDKHVYMVDGTAGCQMADMITVEQIQKVRKEHPDAAVVCYVNSTAEVKTLSDVCVTSSNVVRVVQKLQQKKIYFIPDTHLGHYVAAALPDKDFIFHNGFCPIHHVIDAEAVKQAKKEFPHALVLAHPECTTEVLEQADYVGSTAGIIRHARETEAKEYIIITETGVFHQLEKENPNKKFYPVTNYQVCPNMKKVSLKKIERVLENLEEQEEILLPEEIMEKAKLPLEQMLALAQ
jgi:quinolinate synthase